MLWGNESTCINEKSEQSAHHGRSGGLRVGHLIAVAMLWHCREVCLPDPESALRLLDENITKSRSLTPE